jgi:hypothetical protein
MFCISATIPSVIHCTALATWFWISCGWAIAISGQDEAATEFRLANGATIIVNPIPESDDIAVESGYEVGFVDEPENMVQAAHLLEHLVCYSSGAGFEQKKAFEWLNSVGLANAETMPDWTHYDYMLGSEHLEKILEIEASRLQQSKFHKQLIVDEAQRVYSETDAVERNPSSGMVKHAFMAILHAMRYQSKSALVRGGLEEFDQDRLVEFYRRFYQPQNLTMIFTGKTTVAEVRSLAEKHLAPIGTRDSDFQTEIEWSKVPKQLTVQWDAQPSAVCILWKPPKSQLERTILSLSSLFCYQAVNADRDIQSKVNIVFCSNNSWPVGDVPLFIYAAAKEGQSLDELHDLLLKGFETELRAMGKKSNFLGMMVQQFEHQLKSDWKLMQNSASMIERMGRDEKTALRLALGQDALNRLMIRRLTGPNSESILRQIKTIKPEQVEKIIQDTLTESNRRAVYVVPTSG